MIGIAVHCDVLIYEKKVVWQNIIVENHYCGLKIYAKIIQSNLSYPLI